jgi:hypothetical protein
MKTLLVSFGNTFQMVHASKIYLEMKRYLYNRFKTRSGKCHVYVQLTVFIKITVALSTCI